MIKTSVYQKHGKFIAEIQCGGRHILTSVPFDTTADLVESLQDVFHDDLNLSYHLSMVMKGNGSTPDDPEFLAWQKEMADAGK